MNTSTNTRRPTSFATAVAVVTAAAVIAIGSAAVSEASGAGRQCGVGQVKPHHPIPAPFSSSFIARTGGKAVVGP